jgi:hypothetical protein
MGYFLCIFFILIPFTSFYLSFTSVFTFINRLLETLGRNAAASDPTVLDAAESADVDHY